MSQRTDALLLADIMESIRRIVFYTEHLDYEQFKQDIKSQDAVIRNLEIIGEAAKNISVAFREKHTHIPWKSLAGVRDKLIHHYFGVNLSIVWHIVEVELPELGQQLEKISR